MSTPLRINDVDRDVTLEKTGGDHVVTVAGRRYEVSGASLADGVLIFFVGGRAHRAIVSGNAQRIQITLHGRDYVVARSREGERAAGGVHHHGDGKVEAPMPGNIVSVNVKPGDHVNAGDSLVVLESMKMQNEITSPVSGDVRVVTCRVGEQVGFGQMLVEIAPN